MAKYQLLTEHFVGVELLPAGFTVDTSDPRFANFVPSMHAAPLDPAGEKVVNEIAERRKLRPPRPVEVGFAPNGTVPPEAVAVEAVPMSYSMSTPGVSAVPPGASHVVPRVGDMQVASTAPPMAKPVPAKK